MMNKTIKLLLLASLLISSTIEAYSQSNRWWHGTWILDEEATKENIPELKENALGQKNHQLLLKAAESLEITFTESTIISVINGHGTAEDYTIAFRPNSNSVYLRTGDKVTVYLHEEGHLCFYSEGSPKLKVFFKEKH